MSISAISSSSAGYHISGSGKSDSDTQLQSLKQQLQQLTMHKLQAMDTGDADMQKTLDKQIEKLEEKIRRLSGQSSGQAADAEQAPAAATPSVSALGQYVDVTV